jgi:uncharacterized protein (TIGR02246 family)
MNMRSVIILIGLAIGFALPAISQQTDTPDPQLRQRLIALMEKHNVAINNNDAAGVAAAFTEDGVLVVQEGPSFGRAAIQKFYEDLFQKVHFSNNVTTVDENSPHVIGSDGKAVWATGAWSATIKGEGFGPIDIKGYWSAIRGGEDWKIRLLTANVTPAQTTTK